MSGAISVQLGVRKDVTSLKVSCVHTTDPQPNAPWAWVALLPGFGNRCAKASEVRAKVDYGEWSEHL